MLRAAARSFVFRLAAGFVLLFLCAGAAESDAALPPGNRDKPVDTWPRVLILDPIKANVTRLALTQAVRRLENPSCALLLDEFHDGQGRPLREGLTTLGIDVRSYVESVTFTDDTGSRACSLGALAATMPGSRVVWVCRGPYFETSWRQNPAHVVAALIHEILHTLGLGENPPSASLITEQVLRRCR